MYLERFFVMAFLAIEIATPDLTAIATEHLVTATWALVCVGGFTLIAAVAAALAAFAAYRLEARPGLSLTSSWQTPETPKGGFDKIYVVAQEAGRWALAIREPGDEDNLNGLDRRHVEVRNFSRSAAVAIEISVTARTKAIDTSVDLNDPEFVRDVTGKGTLNVAAIAPNSSTIIPIFGPSGGYEIIVQDVTASRPAYGSGPRQRQRIQFVAAPIIASGRP